MLAITMIGNRKNFRILCFLSAIGLCIYCIIEFSNNDDLSEVSFKKFQGGDENMYPQVYVCFVNQFSESELNNINPEFNSSSYSSFLQGNIWDDRMVDLDIEKITTKLENHILQTCAQSAYRGMCNIEMKIQSFMSFWGTKCIGLNYSSNKRINAVTMWINSSIFLSNGIRPSTPFAFLAAFSYPRQLYLANHQFGYWPLRTKHSDTYSMSFLVRDVEVLRRRNKINDNCIEWGRL